uniref:Cyclin dependent kinase 2 interacting protein n=1 Tax=Sus scrofa TaxID=9823 RepID=A0A8D1G446_PIG
EPPYTAGVALKRQRNCGKKLSAVANSNWKICSKKAHDDIITWVLSFLGFIVMNCSELTKCVLFPLFSILSRSKDETELESSSLASENAEKMHPEYSRELETLCEELQATLDGLTKIQMKMEKLSSTTKGVCELENYHYTEEQKRPLLFHTWPTAHFYAVSRRLSDMYGRELSLKRVVAQELAHSVHRDLALSYLAMWLHQPYVDSDSQLLLESMLLETGHRPL